jgi:sulfur carrier protein ThiS
MPGQPRWAYGPATMSYYNPFPWPVRMRLNFVVSGAGTNPRSFAVRVNGESVHESRVADRSSEVALKATLRPGPNHFDLESREPAVRLSEGRAQLRMFAIHDTDVSLDGDLKADSGGG